MKITTIGFDGDDTLWHHDNLIRAATEEFSCIMNSLAGFEGLFPDARERFDAKHISDLAIWGYGVKGITLSMIELAIELTKGRINGLDIQRIFNVGKQTHLHPITLLDHVVSTIKELHGKYRLILITKGDLIAQEMKIHKSGLEPFFDKVEIISEKNIETYRKILRQNNIKPEEFIMIGNALRSDILPPISLGAQGIHIPYQSSWHYETASISQEDRDKFITLPDMKDVAKIVIEYDNSDAPNLSASFAGQLV